MFLGSQQGGTGDKLYKREGGTRWGSEVVNVDNNAAAAAMLNAASMPPPTPPNTGLGSGDVNYGSVNLTSLEFAIQI